MKQNKNVPVTNSAPEQDLIAQEVIVSLSQAEENMIQKLSPALQVQARQDLITRKTADRIAYLNDPKTKARLDRDQHSREVFSLKYNKETGTLSVYGIGRKWPVALYKSEFVAFLSHIDEIRAAVAAMPDDKE